MVRQSKSSRARYGVSTKIDHLFRTVLRPDAREFTYEDVERGTNGRVSRSYVWKLRHGRNNNPSLDVIEALAEFFTVPPAYFFGDSLDDDPEAQRAAEIAALLRDPSARAVASAARGLGPGAMATVANLIENLHAMESSRVGPGAFGRSSRASNLDG